MGEFNSIELIKSIKRKVEHSFCFTENGGDGERGNEALWKRITFFHISSLLLLKSPVPGMSTSTTPSGISSDLGRVTSTSLIKGQMCVSADPPSQSLLWVRM